MTKRRSILLIFSMVVISGYLIYNYLYKEHRDIENEEPKIEIAASYLLERFEKKETANLVNSTITVTGTITQIEDGAVVLSSGVHCLMNSEIENLRVEQTVAIKGRCIGYDELFGIVKLDQCTLIK